MGEWRLLNLSLWVERLDEGGMCDESEVTRIEFGGVEYCRTDLLGQNRV